MFVYFLFFLFLLEIEINIITMFLTDFSYFEKLFIYSFYYRMPRIDDVIKEL